MIEKLKTINPYDETEIDMDANSVAGLVYENTPLVQKINELVDTVNELQKQYDSVCIWVGKQKLNYNPDTTKGLSTLVEKSKPADRYAEQRKWIGKLCCFWDNNIGEKVWGTLGGIDYSENEKYPYWCDQLQEEYQCCEPVKPDDDIIFKGE